MIAPVESIGDDPVLAGSLAERLRSADARLAVASHQIADLRAYNEHVIDSLLSGLVTTDVQGRVLTFNRAAATITGVPAEQALGQKVDELMQLSVSVRTQLTTLASGRSEPPLETFETDPSRLITKRAATRPSRFGLRERPVV